MQTKGKFRKQVLSTVGEILLITVGILLAFYVKNRKDRALTLELLS